MENDSIRSIIMDNYLFHIKNEIETSKNTKYINGMTLIAEKITEMKKICDEPTIDSFLKGITMSKFEKPWEDLKIEQKKETIAGYLLSQHSDNIKNDQKALKIAIDDVLNRIKKKEAKVKYDEEKGEIISITFNDESDDNENEENSDDSNNDDDDDDDDDDDSVSSSSKD